MSGLPTLWRTTGRGSHGIVHVDRDCGALSASQNFREISLEAARRAEALVCRRCGPEEGLPVGEWLETVDLEAGGVAG